MKMIRTIANVAKADASVNELTIVTIGSSIDPICAKRESFQLASFNSGEFQRLRAHDMRKVTDNDWCDSFDFPDYSPSHFGPDPIPIH
jgi:hypothetical protein